MAIRVLLRGGIYILFIIGAAVAWFLKRQQRANPNQVIISANPIEPMDALQHPHWQIRLEAVQRLAGQNLAENLPKLIAILNDSDSDVRDAAVTAVAAFGAVAVHDVSALLAEGRLNSREAAARALGLIGDTSAIPALVDALKDESAWVRIQAANALSQLITTPEALRALADAHEAESDPAAKAALQAALNAH